MVSCRVTEVRCKTVLVESGLADYTINCYRGCEHGCIYCYARFATRFSHPADEWGSFVDVRCNAVEVLAKEVARRKRGRVFVSSVCDGWQPLEGKYELTRRCLETLIRSGFPLTILTKSRLVSRDLDLMASSRAVELGLTVTTLDQGLSSILEPGASRPTERLGVLEEAKSKGMVTYAFLGPLMPFLSDTEKDLDSLVRRLREIKVDYFYVDRLNPRPKVWPSLLRMLAQRFPSLIPEYRSVLYDPAVRDAYCARVRARALQVAKRHSMEGYLRFCF